MLSLRGGSTTWVVWCSAQGCRILGELLSLSFTNTAPRPAITIASGHRYQTLIFNFPSFAYLF